MTLEKLRKITDSLPGDTVILIDPFKDDTGEVDTVSIEYHTDGRAHLILSDKD